jgi:hypothetical protein
MLTIADYCFRVSHKGAFHASVLRACNSGAPFPVENEASYPSAPKSGWVLFLSELGTHFHRSVIHAGTEFESRMSDLFASLPARIGDSGY